MNKNQKQQDGADFDSNAAFGFCVPVHEDLLKTKRIMSFFLLRPPKTEFWKSLQISDLNQDTMMFFWLLKVGFLIFFGPQWISGGGQSSACSWFLALEVRWMSFCHFRELYGLPQQCSSPRMQTAVFSLEKLSGVFLFTLGGYLGVFLWSHESPCRYFCSAQLVLPFWVNQMMGIK